MRDDLGGMCILASEIGKNYSFCGRELLLGKRYSAYPYTTQNHRHFAASQTIMKTECNLSYKLFKSICLFSKRLFLVRSMLCSQYSRDPLWKRNKKLTGRK